METKSKQNTTIDLREVQFKLFFIYISIMFVIVMVITHTLLAMSTDIIVGKVSSLIAANSRQIEISINSYLGDIESTAALIFADEEYYKYDPSISSLNKYEQIKMEEEIASRIVDLGLMKNFTDFCIVYSNGNRVGWTSNTTADLYDATELYNNLSALITDEHTGKSWVFGFGGVTDRLYYLKRLNPHSILVTSFYTRELAPVFQSPEELHGMSVTLVNEDYRVLYSSSNSSVGESLRKDIKNIILNGDDSDSKFFVCSNKCDNGWTVICYIPKDAILNNISELRRSANLMALILLVLCISIGIFFMRRLIKPMDTHLSGLKEEATIDKLSGIYNKLSFQDSVTSQLSECEMGWTQVFVMIDMDNFKTINDTLGHTVGDNVIKKMGQLIKDQLSKRYTVGRLGGDEFAAYFYNDMQYPDVVTKHVITDMNKLFEKFDQVFEEEKQTVPISLSVGIAVVSNERRFKDLYHCADIALYVSKRSGKNRYTVYDQSMANESGNTEMEENE